MLGWDENAHWLLTARNCYAIDAFGASRESNILTAYKEYVPGASLFHYFVMKTAGHYSNALCRVSMSILLACFLMPALSKYDLSTKKQAARSAVAGLILFLLPFLLYRNAYYSTLVDALLGLVLGFSVVSWLSLTGWRRVACFALAQCALLLIKDSGLFLAELAACAAVVSLLTDGRRTLQTAKKGFAAQMMVQAAIVLLVPVLVKASWGLWLRMEGYHGWDSLTDYRVAKSVLQGGEAGLGAAQLVAFRNFYRTLFWGFKAYDSTRYYFFVLTVPYVAMLLLLTALLLLAGRRQKSGGRAAMVVFWLENFVWLAGTSLLYLMIIPEGELAVLSSVSRYLGTYLLAMALLGVTLLLMRIAKTSWRSVPTAALLALLLLIPNWTVLWRDGYFNAQRGTPLLSFTETKADADYSDSVAYFAPLEEYVSPEDLVILYGGDSEDELRLLFAVAPADCRTASTAEGVDERIAAYDGYGKIWVFSDRHADMGQIASLAEIPIETGGAEVSALYEVHPTSEQEKRHLHEVLHVAV